MVRTCLLSVLVILCQASDALGERIAAAVDRPVGLAHLPAGEVATALALSTRWPGAVVHLQVADADAVRTTVDATGLLNRRVFVDRGDLTRLLPVGRSCDLVVLPGDARLDDALVAEVRRVLHPWYGIAVLPDAPNVEQAAAVIGRYERRNGLHLAIAGPLSGADDWPMWWHGPDNNAVSGDTAYRPPESVQWTGKPYFSTRIELPVIAGGRLFMLYNGAVMDVLRAEPLLAEEEGGIGGLGYGKQVDGEVADLRGPLLTAQAVGSGVRLWHRRLSGRAWMQASRSILVADGDRLLVADGAELLELDAASGEELRRIDSGMPELRWLALAEGRVLVLGGPVTPYTGRRSDDAPLPFRSSGLHLACLDRDSLEPLWRVDRSAGKAFDPRSPAVAGGRIFLACEDSRAVALRLSDGEPLWETSFEVERKRFGFEWDRSSRHPVTGYALGGAYVVSATEMLEAVVFAQGDGRQLWRQETRAHRQMMPLLLEEGKMLAGRGGLIAPLSGKVVSEIGDSPHGGCSRKTAAPAGIVGNQGLGLAFGDDGNYQLPAKSACGAGSLVANGLAWKFPSACTACTEWRGLLVRASSEGELRQPARLWQATGATVADTQTALGWHCYRADNARSMGVAHALGDAAAERWRIQRLATLPARGSNRGTLDAELKPVPAVIAGDTVVVAGNDGSLEALDLASGERRWRALCGGRIASPPALWNGRVYVGSQDGLLSVFALADGRPLWRLRVAPDAGRCMVYGQLGSRWPVLGSPMVQDGRVYVAAGLLGGADGIHALCADARSGEIIWERGDWRAVDMQRRLNGTGQWCWDGGPVFKGGHAPPLRFAADGTPRHAYLAGLHEALGRAGKYQQGTARTARKAVPKGQDIGAVAPGWLVCGGRRFFIEQGEPGTWRASASLAYSGAGGDGRPVLSTDGGTCLLPSWDDRLVVFHSEQKRSSQLLLIAREALLAELASFEPKLATAEVATRLVSDDRKQGAPVRELVQDLVMGKRFADVRRIGFGHMQAPLCWALAGDSLVCLRQNGKGSSPALACYALADGAERWVLPLDGPVVHDGMSIAADGSIVLAMLDGTLRCIATR